MKSTFLASWALWVLVLLGLSAPASAQEAPARTAGEVPSTDATPPTPTDDDDPNALPSRPEAVPEPVAQPGAVDLAAQPAPAAEGAPVDAPPAPTQVIVVTPPPPKPREYKPEEETDQEAAAEERDKGSSLVPKGEDEMMSRHAVERGDIGFKPGKGLEINSADDDFQLRIRVRLQLLYTVVKNWDGDNDPQQDFRMRRARFVFQGHAFGKHNQYKLEVDPLRETPILDYYLDFTQNQNISPRVGQYKLPSNRQRVISSGNLGMVDRSIVNREFTLDRDQAFDLRSRDFLGKGMYRYYAGLGMGNGLNNPFLQNFDMLYFVRVEYLPLGLFRDYSEVDFERTGPRLSLGAAYAYFDGAERQRGMIGARYADGGSSNYHFAYADAMFKVRGFSTLTEFALRDGKRNVGPITEDPDGQPIEIVPPRNGLGWMLQAGYLIPHLPFEIGGRMSVIRKIGAADSTALEDSNAATFALSWYFARHPFKIQADLSQLWGPGAAGGIGGSSFGKGITTARIQLQASL